MRIKFESASFARIFTLMFAIAALTVLSVLLLTGCQNGDNPSVADNDGVRDAASAGDLDLDDMSGENDEGDILNMGSRENVRDDLPDINFGGEDFTILQRTEWNYEFLSESQTGDVVNDAVYMRNLAVEERFNIKLNLVETPGLWEYQDTFIRTVRNSVSAGDDDYQLISGYAAYMPRLQTGGFLLNLHDLEHIDFDRAWWSTDLKDNLTINDKMFLATGDIALSLWEHILAIYFNKQMAADYQLENLYDTVRSGKWTLDKINEVSRSVYRSIDGSGQISETGDIFGYATDTGNLVDNFYGAFDTPVIRKDENGVPYHAQNIPKMAEIAEKVHAFLWENPGAYTNIIAASGPENLYRYIFEENRCMFLPELLGNAQSLRNMDTDFGIIPYPKWDENQDNYLTTSVAYFSLFCVPITVQNLEMTGVITEALCVESYKKVIPAFYEIALKTKHARDDESSEMIDIIRNGLTFDFGKIYVTELAYSMNILRDLITAKNTNFVSTFERGERQYDRALEKVLETFE
ncbi:MAG: hypothetical protein FWH10_05310 [Oscillospiraceae bacterium]|nr:hypothetical protein [Oscillospiraceae bacterium]